MQIHPGLKSTEHWNGADVLQALGQIHTQIEADFSRVGHSHLYLPERNISDLFALVGVGPLGCLL